MDKFDLRAFLVDAPVHYFIELFLVLFILYILGCKRTYNPAKRCGGETRTWRPLPTVALTLSACFVRCAQRPRLPRP